MELNFTKSEIDQNYFSDSYEDYEGGASETKMI